MYAVSILLILLTITKFLKYSTSVWKTFSLYLCNPLESHQRDFSERIPSLSSKTYAERPAVLNVELKKL
jgi:hypothetical protein